MLYKIRSTAFKDYVQFFSTDLPSWLTLSTDGTLSGNPPLVDHDTSYSFNVKGVTVNNDVINRAFTIQVINTPPSWTTVTGSLGTYENQKPLTIVLQSTDPNSDNIVYTVVGGSLPPGLSLSNAGVISGSPDPVDYNQTFNFTIRASDERGGWVDRAFSLTITDINVAPQWQTPSGLLASIDMLTSYSYQLQAPDPNVSTGAAKDTVTYTIVSGKLPGGLTLNSSTGLISGTVSPPKFNVYDFTFTVRASDQRGAYSDRVFSLHVNDTLSYWSTLSSITTYKDYAIPSYPNSATLYTSTDVSTITSSWWSLSSMNSKDYTIPNYPNSAIVYTTDDPSALTSSWFTMSTVTTYKDYTPPSYPNSAIFYTLNDSTAITSSWWSLSNITTYVDTTIPTNPNSAIVPIVNFDQNANSIWNWNDTNNLTINTRDTDISIILDTAPSSNTIWDWNDASNITFTTSDTDLTFVLDAEPPSNTVWDWND